MEVPGKRHGRSGLDVRLDDEDADVNRGNVGSDTMAVACRVRSSPSPDPDDPNGTGGDGLI